MSFEIPERFFFFTLIKNGIRTSPAVVSEL